MARKARLRTRLRYWFDNTMSRGTPSLIGWLAIASVALIVTVTHRLGRRRAGRRRPARDPTSSSCSWRTFISTFSLSVPEQDALAVLALWFLLALGGIFVVSALVGLLTSGLNRRLEQLA